MFGSKEKDQNVKCLQTDIQVHTDGRTTDNRRLEI